MRGERIGDELSGHNCHCTGYAGIIEAVQAAAEEIRQARTGTDAGP